MWKDDAYMLDILLAAQAAREFAADLDWQAFSASKLHQIEPLIPSEDEDQ